MCDTLCVLQSRSRTGEAIFAKNSDRSPNEPHLVIRVPAQDYAKGSQVKLTYITIPQAEHTFETILCKPSWTWGAEMGVNSARVAIGNEAVFTKTKRGPDALTGMDLLRLALERSGSAKEALNCMTSLLEKYGQGGNCGFDHEFYYDNSFMIADPLEGFILDTSGRKWAARQFEGGASISNRLSIHSEHSMRGGVDEGFDFAGKLTRPLFTYLSRSTQRQNSSSCTAGKPTDSAGMMAALRFHDPKDEEKIFKKDSVKSVCMHAGGIGDQTTGSLVVSLRKDKPMTLWCTAASTPCISAFKPVFFGVNSGAPVFESEPEAKKYWLQREAIHRGVLAGLTDVSALRMRRDELEKSWLEEEQKLFSGGTPDHETLLQFSRKAAAVEQEMVNEFTPIKEWVMPAHGRFNRYWTRKNAALDME